VAPTVEVVYETHSLTEDNERGHATGWLPGRLSERGRALAVELGERRRADGLAAVLVSDLRRAAETAEIAFAGSSLPILHDWRLRETDFGTLNGAPTAAVQAVAWEDRFPGGESRGEAVARVDGALDDIAARWAGHRVLVIGHLSAWWALERRGRGAALPLAAPMAWREGWTYEIGPTSRG
jgi:2,3-bisphosphoglycerate-dependent phosphoglycerate mutase